MTDSSQRQEGRTTNQMLKAPLRAVFVWCNDDLRYPKYLARSLGRDDLDVKGISWFQPQNILGIRPPGLVIDHAVSLLAHGRYEALALARSRGIEVIK